MTRSPLAHVQWRAPDAGPPGAVTPVELFFDLVFAFTLTRLTHALEEHLTLVTAAQILIVFGVLWYMYTGYAWLTNHVPPRRPAQKLLLFGGMAGFFLTAIAIPGVFDGTGVLFGLGFLLLVAVHLLLFTQADVGEGIVRLAPFNLAGALLVLAAGFVDGPIRYVLWLLGLFTLTTASYLVPRHSWVGRAPAFHITPAHFVERHGLLVMIALGESVIAIGAAVDITHITLGTVTMIVLALALPGAMWWTYFTDVPSAEHCLTGAAPEMRSRLAVGAYYFAHVPILLGIVVAAAGIHSAIAHPGDRAAWPAAVALAGGVALFMAGVADFRRCMVIPPILPRMAIALVLAATVPVGVFMSAGLHLVIVLGVVVAMLVLEAGRSGAHSHHRVDDGRNAASQGTGATTEASVVSRQ